MHRRNMILLGIALAIGLVAAFVANAYFSGIENRQEKVAKEQQLSLIVVASQDIDFGKPLGLQNLRMASFPKNSIPQGSFASIDEATKGGRVALRPIVPGEPVLQSKASGKATLSANVPVGQFAYAIPVNDVAGVAGFVRPGDRVDVLLTRQIPGEKSTNSDKMADVVLSAIPVLAIDRVASDDATEPAVGKTATLQVDTLGAQKLALATQLGNLTLALRNATDQSITTAPTVLPRQLTTRSFAIRDSSRPRSAVRAPASYSGAAPGPSRPAGPTMTIVRGSQPSEYEVPRGR